MQTIYSDYKKVNSAGGTAIAIGNFDGLHKGHQKLMKVLKDVAYELGIPSVVYTFLEHPANVVCGEKKQDIIYPNEVKEKLIKDIGIHTLFFEDFSLVRDLTPEEFATEILIGKLNVKTAVIGKNGKFGKNCEGNAETLKELGKRYGFSVYIIEPVMINDFVCSSTEIRHSLMDGDVEKAERLLGRPYSLNGVVIEDKKLGRTYGYPTANIVPDTHYISLKRGVYATNVILDGKTYKAITNVGTTSFDEKDKERIESHILDFNENIYGKTIAVEFLYYMRDFKSFTSTQELKTQLDDDKKERKLGGR